MSAWDDIRPSGPDGPDDEPWARIGDRNVWRAYEASLVRTVTRVADGSGRLRPSTRQPCNGCHSARAAAIAAAEAAAADAEARIRDAERRIGICEAAAEILGPLAGRLARALAQLRTVPQDLGEAYELIYEFVRSGGKLPRFARWIEEADA
jgi:acyl-CoA reductase-like NAD-dependent aldehyde dehydrogenase